MLEATSGLNHALLSFYSLKKPAEFLNPGTHTHTNMQKCIPKHSQTNISKSMFVQACTLVQTHARNDTDSKELVWVIREVTEVDASNVW